MSQSGYILDSGIRVFVRTAQSGIKNNQHQIKSLVELCIEFVASFNPLGLMFIYH